MIGYLIILHPTIWKDNLMVVAWCGQTAKDLGIDKSKPKAEPGLTAEDFERGMIQLHPEVFIARFTFRGEQKVGTWIYLSAVLLSVIAETLIGWMVYAFLDATLALSIGLPLVALSALVYVLNRTSLRERLRWRMNRVALAILLIGIAILIIWR